MLFETLIFDIIRSPLRANVSSQDGTKIPQGLVIAFEVTHSENQQLPGQLIPTLHINFEQSPHHNGVELINLNKREQSRIHFVVQLKITGGGIKDSIMLNNLVVGCGERKLKSLHPISIDGLNAIYFKGTVRAVGFENVPLTPKTELRGGIGSARPLSQSNYEVFSDTPSFLKIMDEN